MIKLLIYISQMKIQVRAYFQEAKWFHQKYTPTLDEYMSLSLVTSGYFMAETISFLGMGDLITKESFEWLFSSPKIVKASELIARLMDDMASHKVYIYIYIGYIYIYITN